jgi:hypothetical protein
VLIFLVQAQVTGTVIEVNILMFLVGTVLLQEHNRSRYLAGISTRSTDIKKGFAGMSGNYTAREVEFHLLRNLEFQTFAFGRSFDNPKSIFLRAWGVDMEGFSDETQLTKYGNE